MSTLEMKRKPILRDYDFTNRKTPHIEENPLRMLPKEIWLYIFEFVGYSWRTSIRRTCRAFYEIGLLVVFDPFFYKVYTRHYKDCISLSYLEWALENGCHWNETSCGTLAKMGRLDLLQWAHEKGLPITANVCHKAARGGQMRVLKWLRENNDIWSLPDPDAKKEPVFSQGRWTFENPEEVPWSVSTCASAAKGGHLDVLKWLRENECPWNVYTCHLAARNGHLDVLQWAYENKCPWSGTMSIHAAAGGHLDILEWLCDKTTMDRKTCSNAAAHGRLNVLKWLRERGCPWDGDTCRCAFFWSTFRCAQMGQRKRMSVV